jgi:hypothetical protein
MKYTSHKIDFCDTNRYITDLTIGFFSKTDSNRIKYICVFYFHFFVFLDGLFRTFDIILQ